MLYTFGHIPATSLCESMCTSLICFFKVPSKRMAKRMQHVVPNNVAICCVEMLHAFGQLLHNMTVFYFVTQFNFIMKENSFVAKDFVCSFNGYGGHIISNL